MNYRCFMSKTLASGLGSIGAPLPGSQCNDAAVIRYNGDVTLEVVGELCQEALWGSSVSTRLTTCASSVVVSYPVCAVDCARRGVVASFVA